MKAVKIIAILAAVYVGIVVLFESLLGYFQPGGPGTIVITTVDGDGNTSDRVLSGLENNEQMYVAVNHWPRAWYHRLLENPNVKVTIDAGTARYSPLSETCNTVSSPLSEMARSA